ncbi:MAG: hypothetical protein P3X24_008505, partial [bacterium]|nr:hypothetical protein [bacterium]
MKIRKPIGVASVWAAGLLCMAWSDVTLYAGQPAAESGLTLRSWGAGTIEDSTETTFVGSRSVKILTRGMLSGGWMVFGNPIDLRSDLNAPDKVVRFTLRFAGGGAAGGAVGGGGIGAPPPPGDPGGFGAPGGPEAPGGLGAPGGPRGGAGATQTTAPP